MAMRNPRCEELGYVLTRPQLEDLYQRFLALADNRKQGVANEEIKALLL